MSHPLILASTSPYRRALLDRLGLPYRALPHRTDETALAAGAGAPEEIAVALARAKAESLAPEAPDAFILGSDQVVDVDGRILGKPGTAAGARAQLALLAGRAHRLLTAVALRHPDGRVESALDVHVLRMRPLDEAARARYVEREAPLDCCGSYKIEGLGIALFEEIRGGDFTAIVGLPMLAVVRMLAAAGFELP